MSETHGFDPLTGTWNDSLTGDYLWSRNNFGEARPDVMSPFTYSLSEKVWSAISPLPGYQLSGNICGRYYANVSFSISIVMALGKSKRTAVEQMRDLLGSVPEGLEIPVVPLPRWKMLQALPRMIGLGLKEKSGAKRVPEFMATNAARCQALRRRIQVMQTNAALAAFWRDGAGDIAADCRRIAVGKRSLAARRLGHKLAHLVARRFHQALQTDHCAEIDPRAVDH